MPPRSLILVASFCFLTAPVYSEDATTSSDPDARRFEAEKQSRLRTSITAYLVREESKLQKAWQAPSHTGLLITKTKISIGETGYIIDQKILTPSSSTLEDKSVTELVKTFQFSPLPAGVKALDLYLSFMSDGTLSMVEISKTPEASEYYAKLFATPKDLDFGPYMADLQRRIKRAWLPPKGNESKRVTVQFKVHRGGELSNLRIDKSSGMAIADQAALKAVENAAPFLRLPPGAHEDVDIQFTFDWNVFGGGGHGTFRSF